MRILTCKRCDYRWQPRVTKPILCPGCKSAHWDKKRVRQSRHELGL